MDIVNYIKMTFYTMQQFTIYSYQTILTQQFAKLEVE